ncbi:YARHG domain-containing protein [Okeanomitos corallinicola TIOX110]|uniref:non-specific serine/threonine protein kinase n=1 Tax=Okeanomitos corallinicola TIOX110 TaxID=3133117 RepID=A0ABZ2UXT1_9CYAN
MKTMLLNNRYQVIRTLGSGGFGETFLAQDTNMPSQRLCVVKQLKPIHNNPQVYQIVQERFQREAAILETLGSASNQIPALYAYFSTGGEFYLVQEWIEGDTLTAKMQKQGLFTEREIEELLLNILPVLEYVHSQKIVHRDIKPDNIIIRNHDKKPVLIDFGAVRESMTTVLNSQGHPTSSIVIGTPGFMSSEQAAGRPVYSSDLYSLGLTAIYLLTGKPPQTLETDPQTGEIIWRHFASHVNPILAGVIDKAITYHPRDRFASAREMLIALQNQYHLISTIQNQEIPPTQQPTVPSTINNFAKPVINNKSKNIIIGSLIISGLTGASIITQIINKSLETVKEAEISISTKRTNPTNEQQEISSEYKISKSIVRNTPTTINKSEIKTPSVQEIKTTNNGNNYFWLSQRRVTEADLAGKSGYELDIMRNTIFAVHGRRFNISDLQEYFNQQSWYNPRYSPQAFPINLLSKIEIKNAEFINQYQNRYNLRHFKE